MLEAVTLLVDHGVDVNAFNANGQTILHNAAQRGPELGHRVRGRRKAPSSIGATSRVAPRSTSRSEPAAADGGRAARPTAPVVNEKTAALLRELMAKK